MTAEVRGLFLGTARATLGLLYNRELGERWEEPGALGDFDMGSLAAHTARSVLQVEWALDMPEPEPPATTAGHYFADLVGAGDAGSDLNAGVRERASETAERGWGRLYLDASNALDRLAERLPVEPAERRVTVFGGRVLTIDEYLRTRVVELVVHVDDLATSLGVDPPALPDGAAGTAIEVLVDAARVRHGDRAVLHALARRERDAVEALRVL